MKGFGSDNHSGIHPEILNSIVEGNSEHAPSYGGDPITTETEKLFCELFKHPVKVFFVYNGTSANVLSLRAMTRPWNSILCSDISHLNVDEGGAPEFATGCKLVPLATTNGKISISILESAMIRMGDQHHSQPKVVSITQPTELGTCYSIEEIQAISKWAKQKKLYFHVDGSRIANAVVSLNTSFEEMISKTGVDILSFGGTKNGLMFGEAVIIFNNEFSADFKYNRKQLGQLPSKTRFISGQFRTYLKNNLWRKIAEHSLAMAKFLFENVNGIPQVEVTQPVQSNAVFVKIPQKWVSPLREKFFFYVWDEHTFECRWMTSFDTQKSEILEFSQELKKLSNLNL